MADLPPLEPISSQETVRVPTMAGSSSAQIADGQLASNPSTVEQASVDNGDPTRNDDTHSMPSLRSVSDSSDEDSVDEVEMLPDLRPVEDDNDSNWTDEDLDDLPPLEPIAGNRRARVEDDEDDDRDRRHPTQRTNNAQQQSAANQQPPNVPPFFGGNNGPRTGTDARPNMLDLFQMFMGGAGPPPGGAPQAANTGANGNNQNDDPDHQHGAPPFQFRFEMGDGQRTPQNGNNNNGGLPPALAELLFPDMTPEQRANPFLQFQAVLERIGAIGQAFGFSMEEEKEDPERAKKLVAGLELVPAGLVRRMERVGGAPGGHVDDSTGEVEVPGCAICWDKLLDAEGDGFKVAESDIENSREEDIVDRPVTYNDDSSTEDGQRPTTAPLAGSSSDPTTPVIPSNPLPLVDVPPVVSAAHTENEEPKIVSLPCAHVFHASCLIPWFSRPRQTTCPTCRFNIDPENLTYIPRPRPQPQPQPQATGAGPAPAPAPVNGDASATADPDIPPLPNPPPTAGAGVADGRAFPPVFGMDANGPFEFFPPPPPVDGAADPGQDFAAGLFGPFFGGIRMEAGPGATQGAQAPPAPMGNMGGIWPGGTGNMDPNAQGMVTFDVTLVTNAPFDAPNGPNLRRQTHVFANQFFGGNVPGPGPPPFMFGTPPPAPGAGPMPAPRGFRPPQPRERKQWTPPPAPGPTLRSRVEQREREVGLRCFDTSCGVGPSDEEPFPETSDVSMKQLSIRPLVNSMVLGTSVCSHTFHPACLVSAERVAGWGGENKKEQQVEVSCPNCRAVGCVERFEWEEGVRALV